MQLLDRFLVSLSRVAGGVGGGGGAECLQIGRVKIWGGWFGTGNKGITYANKDV